MSTQESRYSLNPLPPTLALSGKLLVEQLLTTTQVGRQGLLQVPEPLQQAPTIGRGLLLLRHRDRDGTEGNTGGKVQHPICRDLGVKTDRRHCHSPACDHDRGTAEALAPPSRGLPITPQWQ